MLQHSLAADLNTLNLDNLLCKCADNTYSIIPSTNSHIRLAEIDHVETWNMVKTQKLNS